MATVVVKKAIRPNVQSESHRELSCDQFLSKLFKKHDANSDGRLSKF